jgi:dihydrolipoamide dehydrogenase
MAPRATDMIGEVCAAMRAEGTIDELIDTVHAHPTVSEMIMEAAHDTEGLCVHK